MDTTKNLKIEAVQPPSNGIYVRGVVISNHAVAFRRKDGSGIIVKVEHEISLQPGMAIWERYFDPRESPEVKCDGENVVDFPRLPEFQSIVLRAEKFKMNGEKFIVSRTSGSLK